MTEKPDRKWRILPDIHTQHPKNSPAMGYTLVELMVACSIVGILSALVVNANPWYQNSLGNSRDQVASLLSTVRLKAMSTTSTYRVRPDPANPTRQLKVEQTRGGSCQASTTLKTAETATDTSLGVKKDAINKISYNFPQIPIKKTVRPIKSAKKVN